MTAMMNFMENEPKQLKLYDDDYVHDVYLIETDAEALASAGFGTDEDYNHFDSWEAYDGAWY